MKTKELKLQYTISCASNGFILHVYEEPGSHADDDEDETKDEEFDIKKVFTSAQDLIDELTRLFIVAPAPLNPVTTIRKAVKK